MKTKSRKEGVVIPVNLLKTVFGIEDDKYSDAEFDTASNSIVLYKKK